MIEGQVRYQVRGQVSNWDECPVQYLCYGDINCDGRVDISDILLVISNWGPCDGIGLGVPRSVQDCMNRFPLGNIQLEKCLQAVEFFQTQGSPSPP